VDERREPVSAPAAVVEAVRSFAARALWGPRARHARLESTPTARRDWLPDATGRSSAAAFGVEVRETRVVGGGHGRAFSATLSVRSTAVRQVVARTPMDAHSRPMSPAPSRMSRGPSSADRRRSGCPGPSSVGAVAASTSRVSSNLASYLYKQTSSLIVVFPVPAENHVAQRRWPLLPGCGPSKAVACRADEGLDIRTGWTEPGPGGVR
jgi:hypothetical protein